MLTTVESAHVEEFARQPGVVILDWRHPKSGVSLLFDQILERASEAHGDVRFGSVDLSKDDALAREWQITEVPTLMGFRDGILVFSRPGPLPDVAVNGLVDALWSLDMDEVRRGLNGRGSRIVITFRSTQE